MVNCRTTVCLDRSALTGFIASFDVRSLLDFLPFNACFLFICFSALGAFGGILKSTTAFVYQAIVSETLADIHTID